LPSNFNKALFDGELLKKTGKVIAKMQNITEFDDLSLIDKMKRHQCLIAALNEFSIMMDVLKRNKSSQLEIDELRKKMKDADY
jgi:hypothetical protein